MEVASPATLTDCSCLPAQNSGHSSRGAPCDKAAAEEFLCRGRVEDVSNMPHEDEGVGFERPGESRACADER